MPPPAVICGTTPGFMILGLQFVSHPKHLHGWCVNSAVTIHKVLSSCLPVQKALGQLGSFLIINLFYQFQAVLR